MVDDGEAEEQEGGEAEGPEPRGGPGHCNTTTVNFNLI